MLCKKRPRPERGVETGAWAWAWASSEETWGTPLFSLFLRFITNMGNEVLWMQRCMTELKINISGYKLGLGQFGKACGGLTGRPLLPCLAWLVQVFRWAQTNTKPTFHHNYFEIFHMFLNYVPHEFSVCFCSLSLCTTCSFHMRLVPFRP